MKIEDTNLKIVLELITKEEVIIKSIKKDLVTFRVVSNKRKNIKMSIHTIVAELLVLITNKSKVYIKIFKGSCIIKIGKLTLEFDNKEWVNGIMFLSLLKMKDLK